MNGHRIATKEDFALAKLYDVEGNEVRLTPVGKGVSFWFDWDTGNHKLITDYDRKRRYLDGKRIPWGNGSAIRLVLKET